VTWYVLDVDDTRPQAHRVMRDAYRRMTPAQKLRRVVELGRSVEAFARARLREELPDASEREITLRVAALRFDRATMERVFGRGDLGGRPASR
jgi:hypothetical protein